MTEPRPPAIALGAIAGLLTTISLYALIRGVQLLLFREPNPATVIWSEHAGYFWRIWISAYAGGMAALLAGRDARKNPMRIVRMLGPLVMIAAALIAVQGLFLP